MNISADITSSVVEPVHFGQLMKMQAQAPYLQFKKFCFKFFIFLFHFPLCRGFFLLFLLCRGFFLHFLLCRGFFHSPKGTSSFLCSSLEGSD